MDDKHVTDPGIEVPGLAHDVFGGKVPLKDAIEKLRTKLLDLSSNNRLLRYRHPKGRCIQIVGSPNLNQTFGQLVDGRLIRLLPVPDPPPDLFEGRKKPDVRIHAERLGISESPDFAPSPLGPHSGRRLPGLQILHYPTDMDRLARKVANEAKTAIEETGSNMLFVIFGFLEFYDTDESDRAFLAPILSIPASIVKGSIDPDTRIYQWSVQHSGEDLPENATLSEKLKQFSLELPQLEDEEEPESLFQRIENAIKSRPRWKVKRQITIGMLSFGKLAIWTDLDPNKHPGLLTQPLIRTVFEGGEPSGDTPFFAEDYRIDERLDADAALVYDADSSQHSAIIDVLSGKNVVINGPPGTGKSQTITNIISTALTGGKKVLFVSEKLAALEVVRDRLNKANLGHFCLELHSHKTQKKKFIEDIDDRIRQTFRAPSQFRSDLETLRRLKQLLGRYAKLIGSTVGNALGLTVNEIFWACERRRLALGDLASVATKLDFPQASDWSLDHVRSHRTRIEALADAWVEIGRAGRPHPWEGFEPKPFVPGDDDTAGRILKDAAQHFCQLIAQAQECADLLERSEPLSMADILETVRRLKAVPELPDQLLPELLSSFFCDRDPRGQHSEQAINRVTGALAQARELRSMAYLTLREGHQADPDILSSLARNAEAILLPSAIDLPREELERLGKDLRERISEFRIAVASVFPLWSDITEVTANRLVQKLTDSAIPSISQVTISEAEATVLAVANVNARMKRSLDRIENVAKRWNLPFDDQPRAIARLLDPDAIEGSSEGAPIAQEELQDARDLVSSPLLPALASLDLIANMHNGVIALRGLVSEALHRCAETAKSLGLPCDGPTFPEEELAIVVAIMEKAPLDLLRYRHPCLADRSAAAAIASTRAGIEAEAAMRAELESIFHLDALPPISELKATISVFRRSDRYFNFLSREWRKAVRIYGGIAKERQRRRAEEMAASVSSLLTWIDHRENFESNLVQRNCLGDLFQGFATEIAKAEKLHAWHVESQALLLRSATLRQHLDLVSVDASSVEAMAASCGQLRKDLQTLKGCAIALEDILGTHTNGSQNTRRNGWPEMMAYLDEISDTLSLAFNLFSRHGNRDLTPARILQLMEGRTELASVRADVAALADGKDQLRLAGGELFKPLLSEWDAGWRETITMIDTASANAADLLRLLKGHFLPTTTVAGSGDFMLSKASLDRAVAAVAPSREVSSWEAYVAHAEAVAAIISDLVTTLEPAMAPGKSAADGFAAIRTLARAEAIIADIESDQDTACLFGAALKGFETDDDAIVRTHRWGAAVLNTGLQTDLRRRLVQREARFVLSRARELFSGMETAHSSAMTVLGHLSDLGKFDLAVWNRDTETPADFLDKAELALLSADTIMPLSRWVRAATDCKRDGLGDLVGILEQRMAPAEALGELFECAVYLSIAKQICREYQDISTFNGSAHTRLREEFQRVDRQLIAYTGHACAQLVDSRKLVPDGMRGALASEFTEMHLLRREIAKQKRHIPIRQLMKRAGRALQELKPCFMMGPLSVAQYLEPEAVKFDLVVMDEASQLRPEDAIGAIARGSQLVVVGDQKQLPPTSFFDSWGGGDLDEDDEAVAVVHGVESILDIAQQTFTPARSLRWHYRSQHESLIAFSNHYFYRNLVVFPSPDRDKSRLGVKWRYVRDGIYEDRRNVQEAKRVTDAVVWHMKACPDESLGAVTLNITQRDLVEELLDRYFKENDECRAFLGRWEEEGWPFFVKNLENVQGDERDCIMISATFGRPRNAARVRQNFGPISRPNGWRRLNVLFTRARRRVELFTSMQPEDIILDEKTPEGTRTLRNYLDYAKRGILTSVDQTSREPDSDFEVAVARVLTSRGYEIRPQLGVAGYFIDLAVKNPDRPGEWLAAIECDGATYHSGLSVRDRDRIRQEILESLGWRNRIYRLWSTDWFYNPVTEVSKLIAFLEERRAESASEQVELAILPWDANELETIASRTEEDDRVIESLQQDESGANPEDLFVEVGDQVTYCFADRPSVRMSVHIVDGASVPGRNEFNEQTPIARALLDLAQGETGTLNVIGQKLRSFRILKIERQSSGLAAARATA
jgi:transcription elongation GreA/GreB family factor